MKSGVVLGRGRAVPFGRAAVGGLERRAGRRRTGAQARGRRPCGDSLLRLKEVSRVVRLLRIGGSRRGLPVLVMVVLMLGVFGPGRLAALHLVRSRPVSRLLPTVTILREARLSLLSAALRPAVIGRRISRVRVSRLAERSPCARLAVLRPARVIVASSSGGMMLMSPVAPVIARTGVPGPVVRCRGSQQGSSGLAFGEIGAHRWNEAVEAAAAAT